ncbi:ataxin-10 [Chrysoperla carnea]|uniref:ataxin-10 n=1 Tax=Chrysoperla carnea TaxID=189513 RepID=UPI001D05CE87|nr:ataxin-10 [Chrysoperla carnea]
MALPNKIGFDEMNTENSTYEDLTKYLQDEFKLKCDETGQYSYPSLSDQTIIKIIEIINELKTNVDKQIKISDSLPLLRQIYLTLRNSVAIHKSVQKKISINNEILDLTNFLITALSSNETYINCLIVILQFLGNLVTQNEQQLQVIIWDKFNEILLLLFHSTPNRIPSIVGMILYNIFLQNKQLIPDDIKFIKNAIILYESESDYGELLLELLLQTNILIRYYSELEVTQRFVLLELIKGTMFDDESTLITNELMMFISTEFKKKSDCILKTVTDYVNKIEPQEVVCLLDIIASASCLNKYSSCLIQDKSLLINCVFLLKSIHSVGKEGNNHFSAIQKLSELTLNEKIEPTIKDHPGFGFKAALIRVVGNLCWKNTENQNLVRELEGIQLLLDCCNIDARNPFIIQWVIFAVRNLCEGNPDNQKLIAGMTKAKTVDSETLQKMGIVLNDDSANKIGIIPMDLKK